MANMTTTIAKLPVRALALVIFFSLVFSVHAQEDTYPCDAKSSQGSWKKLFKTKKATNLYFFGRGPFLSTSTLIPTKGKPKKPQGRGGYDTLEYDNRYEDWSCKYAPMKAWDNDPKTAWVEGTQRYGIGEILIIDPEKGINPDQKMEIWTGYGKSQKLHKENSRPKELRVVVIEGVGYGPAQDGIYFKELRIISENIVKLEDLNKFQKLPVKKFNKKKGATYILGLQILQVYKGSKYKDTCISEIRNR